MVRCILPYPLEAIPTDPRDPKTGKKGGEFGATYKRTRPHRGTDWSLFHVRRLGLNPWVPCVAAGTVVAFNNTDTGELGKWVEVRDDEGWFWTYCHAEQLSQFVKLGARFEFGNLVVLMGSTGTAAATGAEHLHLALSNVKGGGINGVVFDPVVHILARQSGIADLNATPIEGFLMALSDDEQKEMLNHLRNINAWVWGGGPGVDQGVFGRGTLAQRIVNMDRQLTGAQGQTPNLVGRVIDAQARLAALGAGGIDTDALGTELAAKIRPGASAGEVQAAVKAELAAQAAKLQEQFDQIPAEVRREIIAPE